MLDTDVCQAPVVALIADAVGHRRAEETDAGVVMVFFEKLVGPGGLDLDHTAAHVGLCAAGHADVNRVIGAIHPRILIPGSVMKVGM